MIALPFYKQRINCGAAAIKMVLAKMGIDSSEEEIASHGKLDGKAAFAQTKGVKVKLLGISKKKRALPVTQQISTLTDLKRWLRQGITPIINVNWQKLMNKNHDAIHAIIINGIREETIYYIDPNRGQRRMKAKKIIEAWQEVGAPTLLITPKRD